MSDKNKNSENIIDDLDDIFGNDTENDTENEKDSPELTDKEINELFDFGDEESENSESEGSGDDVEFIDDESDSEDGVDDFSLDLEDENDSDLDDDFSLDLDESDKDNEGEDDLFGDNDKVDENDDEEDLFGDLDKESVDENDDNDDDDLFGGMNNEDEDDLFGGNDKIDENDDEEDLFGDLDKEGVDKNDDENDDDDLFGGMNNEDEDDLFGDNDKVDENDDEEDLFGDLDKESVDENDDDDLFGDMNNEDEDDLFGGNDKIDENDDEEDLFGNLDKEGVDEDDADDLFQSETIDFDEDDKPSVSDVFEDDDLDDADDEESNKDVGGFDDFDQDTIEKEVFDSNLKEEKNKKEKRGIFSMFGKNKKQKTIEESDDSSVDKKKTGIDELLERNKKPEVMDEQMFHVVKKGTSVGTAIFASSIITLSLVAAGLYFGKSYIADFLFIEKQLEIAQMDRTIKNQIEKIDKAIIETQERSDRKFVTNDQVDVLFANLNASNISDIDTLRDNLNKQIKELNALSVELTNSVNRIEELENGDANHSSMIAELQTSIDSQRELIRRTIQITLDVIQQNREIEARISESVHNRLSAQVREDMRRQRQELYDFSLIEDRITEALNKNAELARELSLQKEENARVLSQLTALGVQIEKLDGQIETLSAEPKDTGNKVIEELTRNPDNTISIRRNEIEEQRINNQPIINNPPKEVSEDVLRKVNVIGVLEDRFYVKTESDNSWQIYKIGDKLEGYGKILKIENQKIYAEKGIVRTK